MEQIYTARAAARVNGAAATFLGNDGGFTEAGLSRTSAGLYRLTLGRTYSAGSVVSVAAEHTEGLADAVPNYRWISSTILEVFLNAPNGGGAIDAVFSIEVKQLA